MGFVDGNLKPSKLAEHFTISDVRANQIKRPVNSEYFRRKWSSKKGFVDVNLKPSELAGHFTNKK
mgnify:CR=1 FL=1